MLSRLHSSLTFLGERRPCPCTPVRQRSFGIKASLGPSAGVAAVRRLVLLRHGQARDEKSVVDHQRSLTGPGRDEVARVARRLHDASFVPSLILCSDTVRSRETIEALQEADDVFGKADISFLGSLYVAAAMDGETRKHLKEQILVALGELQNAGSDVSCIMCVGHNKGWEEAASQLAGQDVELDPACAAVLESGESWQDALEESHVWTLRAVLTP